MIVVVGRVCTDAEKRAQMLEVAHKVATASREEEGCVDYRVFEDTEQPNNFVFVEEWKDEDALQQHFATPHIAEFMQAVMGTIVAPPDVRFHEIASTRDLSQVGAG
ncbi:MAG TPA: putative quinol monooxygenase [Solirubrobacteraceae bacterium]|nr:putative quinol monooxygenase [Solirubrobacteraceae bacterium]